jgi:arginyl-tRNA synthetase
VDFSSPNIAKEMHVGHLRSTIIGEAICRILEAAGHKCHRINHVGDWGTQFGMLIQYLREEYPDVVVAASGESGSSAAAELPNITDLTAFYKNAKQRFDESEEFKTASQLNVVALQSGDAECRLIWQMLCDVSRREFQKVYQRLDITCQEFGESFYNDKISPVIQEFEAAGKVEVAEGGAKCVFNRPTFAVPLMLQKSDGGYGYDSTDMAALRYRLKDLQADRIIVITDSRQADHFKMVYAAGRDIGWVDRGQRLEHIGFGMVQGEDGKSFKTRSGDTVRLVDLLDEAVSRMETTLQERLQEGKSSITDGAEIHQVSEAIGYGAVKYFDLRRNPTSNYKFSYDEMLSTRGDTAVYLLYARARLESIVAKAAAEHQVVVDELLSRGVTIVLTDAAERGLALQLQSFADTMAMTLEDLYPFHICEYVYKLATAASDFVTKCRVLGSPEMESRVLLCHATCMAMHQCFDLLGIRHVKRI